MSYTVESINDCTKKLVFNFETVDLTTEIDSALKKKQKESNLKGFRKGKAPITMIKQLYGGQAENEALYNFVSSKFFEAVQTEDIKAIGYPKFDKTEYKSESSEVSFEATVEIFPAFEVKDYSKYSFTREAVEVTDEDLKLLKDRYLSSKAEVVEVTDAKAKLAKGMTAVLNFQGITPDGEKPENMKGEEYLLEIGSGQFIPGFEDGLIGMKKGENKELELTFPEDYHMEELKNAKVKFETELLEIKEKKVPEFNDEMAKEFGFESVEDFATKNKEQIKVSKERQSSEKLHQDILEKLIADNSFDVPSTLVVQQTQSVHKELKGNLQQQGFTDDMVKEYFTKWADDINEKATFQVRSGLILDQLAKKFEVEATDADLTTKIDEIAAQSGMTKEQVEQFYLSNENLKNNMKYAIREEKTFEMLIKEMKVK